MQIIRTINKPYHRIEIIFGGLCCIVDGAVCVMSLGYLETRLQMWWIDRMFDKVLVYYKTDEQTLKNGAVDKDVCRTVDELEEVLNKAREMVKGNKKSEK